MKKIVGIGNSGDLDDAYGLLGKQTVYVTADPVFQIFFSFHHTVIPLIISYGMAKDLQSLLCRLNRGR